MKRRLFNVLSALSLVLCIAIIAIWVLSCFRVDPVKLGRYAASDDGWQQNEWTIWASGGVLQVQGEQRWYTVSPGYRSMVDDFRKEHPDRWVCTWPKSEMQSLLVGRPDPPSMLNRMGFWLWTTSSTVQNPSLGRVQQMYVLALPHWLFMALASLLPAYWIKRRYRKQKPGLCPTCGYDLRASKERCPECGTAVPAQTANSGGKV